MKKFWVCGAILAAASLVAGCNASAKKSTDMPANGDGTSPLTKQDFEDSLKQSADEAAEAAKEAAEDAKEAAEEAVEGAKKAAEDAVEGAKDAAEDAKDAAKDAADDATDKVKEAVDALKGEGEKADK